MSSDSILKSLHPLEIKTLLHVAVDTEFESETLERQLLFNTGQSNQALSWLAAKSLTSEASRVTHVLYERTDLGAEFASTGTPVERIVGALENGGPQTMRNLVEATGLEQKDVGSVYGRLSKLGVLAMDEEKRVTRGDAELPASETMLRQVLERSADAPIAESSLNEEERAVVATNAKKRGASSAMFRIIERETVRYRLTQEGVAVRRKLADAGMTGEEIGRLTPEMLRDGSWKDGTFRTYALDGPISRLLPGRRNPYSEYLDSVKDKLVSLGFAEFDGPLVETEFWNSDALFMPQFHSARDIHDVYYVKEPHHAREIEEPYLSNVAAAHENGWTTGSRGWGYDFDRDFTRRLILRSQGTVMSAKALPRAEVPGKYFGILRCFRYDQVDATHLSDFYQTEGIVLGDEVNLRTLLGLLRMFAEELAGATEVKYVPGYFPFTEPSVEVHIKHPRLGWFELGGSGIFRPEVTKPMGIDVPVLAWGLGIDRMALMHLGLNDLRELFSSDIESIRLRRRSA